MLVHFLTTFATLFVIVDPIGTVPVFLSLTARYEKEKRREIARRAILISAGVLLFFALFGKFLFDIIGVRLLSFEIAGGVMLFLFGLKMAFDKPEGFGMPAESEHDVAVFPLAIPSIAGPGAMLGVVIAANHPTYSLQQQITAAIALLLVLTVGYLILLNAVRIQHWIGKTGALILSRVMGIILTAIATEAILQALARLNLH